MARPNRPQRVTPTIIPNTIQAIENPSMDYPCEVCNDKPATKEGIVHLQTCVDPPEWLGVCDDCGREQEEE